MKKFCRIILNSLIVVILFVGTIVLADYIVFTIEKQKMLPEVKAMLKFKYFIKEPLIFMEDPIDFFVDTDTIKVGGRAPDGLEYKGKMPIVVFGCSVAEGLFLKNTQTFSYKLSHILKRPVYNRAIGGGGLQHMYLQVLSKRFYDEVPPSDTIIYIFTQFHYRLLSGETWNVTDNFLYPYFELENGKLKYADFKNPILNYIRCSYLIRLIVQKYNNVFFFKKKNEEYLTDFVTEHFVETRNVLENHPKYKSKHIKPKMIVVFYENIFLDSIKYRITLKKKLESNGIMVIDTNDLGFFKYKPEYFSLYGHPSEKVWDIVTPFVAERMVQSK